jgi:hypothetical protein
MENDDEGTFLQEEAQDLEAIEARRQTPTPMTLPRVAGQLYGNPVAR